jgi:sec-independent protein translocase protein TatA
MCASDLPTCGSDLLVLVLVLFRAKKVPETARGFGQGMKEFKKSMSEAAAVEGSQTTGKDER